MTGEEIKEYLIDNYGECRHNENAMSHAIHAMAKETDIIPEDIFHFMVEQKPIPGMNTHSYGFNTAEGRDVRQTFEGYYYEYLQNERYEY